MVNLRYHIVSIVAVFLALGIGILMGSTIVDRALVDNLNSQLDGLQRNLEDAQRANESLQADADRLRRQQDALADEGTGQLFDGRLATDRVLVLAVQGVDEASLTELRRSVVAAGAEVPPVLWFTDKLRLERASDAGDLAALLGERQAEPARLRTVLAARLARLLRQSGVGVVATPAVTLPGDQAAAPTIPSPTVAPETVPPATLPATPPPDGAAPSDTVAPATTTTLASDQPDAVAVARAQAADELRLLVAALRAGGFMKQDGQVALPDMVGAQLVMASGAQGLVPDTDLAVPLLLALAADGVAPAVAVEATVDGAPTGADGASTRGAFVGQLRTDELLRSRISTVDDLETFAGRAATVLALGDLADGRVGQYGVGEGAQRLLPAPVP